MEHERNRPLRGKDFLEILCEALEIEYQGVSRIVIDADRRSIVMVYIQRFGDERLLKLDWPGALKDAAIRYEKKKS